MRLLALDLATTTGWALADMSEYQPQTILEARAKPQPMPLSGSVRIGPKGCDLPTFLASYRYWFDGQLVMYRPNIVIFEQPILGQNTSLPTARKLYSLAGLTELLCMDANLKCYEAHNMTVRKHFTGYSHNPKKEKGQPKPPKRTYTECIERKWNVDDDNHADALAILDYAMATLGRKYNATNEHMGTDAGSERNPETGMGAREVGIGDSQYYRGWCDPEWDNWESTPDGIKATPKPD